MDKKFTAIYQITLQTGSQWNYLTQVKRIFQKDNETLEEALKKENVYDSLLFLFEGWSKLEGETDYPSHRFF
jgi:hypothetical protein